MKMDAQLSVSNCSFKNVGKQDFLMEGCFLMDYAELQ